MELISKHIEDADVFVRRAAIAAVSNSRSATSDQIALIRQFISSKDDVAQREAVLASGRLKDFQAIPVLIELLTVENEGRRTEVHWALREITGKDFAYDVDAWLDWWEFYQREVVAKRKAPGQEEGKPVDSVRPPTALATDSSQASSEASTRSFQFWMAGILGLLVLALPAAWTVCRLWLRASMNRLLRVDPAVARDPAAVALRFAASDHMPDWIVYPFLARCVTKGSALEVNVALNVLVFRLHGGCAQIAVNGGRLPRETPVPGARERVMQFPRGLLADMAMAGYQSSRCLIRIAEPDNPAWQRESTIKEKLVAERHLSSLLKKSR